MTILKDLKTSSLNREAWLIKAKVELAKKMQKQGVNVPDDCKVSCGWTQGSRKALGSCHNRASSKAKINEIFLSPVIEKAEEVLEILVHEMIHASDDCESKHGAYFSQSMKKVGLIGKPTATIANTELRRELAEMVKSKLGAYPHSEMLTAKPKQSTRMIKMICEECDWSFYASQKMIDDIEYNRCMCCDEEDSIIVAPKKKR